MEQGSCCCCRLEREGPPGGCRVTLPPSSPGQVQCGVIVPFRLRRSVPNNPSSPGLVVMPCPTPSLLLFHEVPPLPSFPFCHRDCVTRIFERNLRSWRNADIGEYFQIRETIYSKLLYTKTKLFLLVWQKLTNPLLRKRGVSEGGKEGYSMRGMLSGEEKKATQAQRGVPRRKVYGEEARHSSPSCLSSCFFILR